MVILIKARGNIFSLLTCYIEWKAAFVKPHIFWEKDGLQQLSVYILYISFPLKVQILVSAPYMQENDWVEAELRLTTLNLREERCGAKLRRNLDSQWSFLIPSSFNLDKATLVEELLF